MLQGLISTPQTWHVNLLPKIPREFRLPKNWRKDFTIQDKRMSFHSAQNKISMDFFSAQECMFPEPPSTIVLPEKWEPALEEFFDFTQIYFPPAWCNLKHYTSQ